MDEGVYQRTLFEDECIEAPSFRGNAAGQPDRAGTDDDYVTHAWFELVSYAPEEFSLSRRSRKNRWSSLRARSDSTPEIISVW